MDRYCTEKNNFKPKVIPDLISDDFNYYSYNIEHRIDKIEDKLLEIINTINMLIKVNKDLLKGINK